MRNREHTQHVDTRHAAPVPGTFGRPIPAHAPVAPRGPVVTPRFGAVQPPPLPDPKAGLQPGQLDPIEPKTVHPHQVPVNNQPPQVVLMGDDVTAEDHIARAEHERLLSATGQQEKAGTTAEERNKAAEEQQKKLAEEQAKAAHARDHK